MTDPTPEQIASLTGDSRAHRCPYCAGESCGCPSEGQIYRDKIVTVWGDDIEEVRKVAIKYVKLADQARAELKKLREKNESPADPFPSTREDVITAALDWFADGFSLTNQHAIKSAIREYVKVRVAWAKDQSSPKQEQS